MTDIYWLAPAFFTVALVYSMAGFGGGSSYLALLAMSGLAYQTFAPISLVCNLLVASSGLYHFSRAGHLALRIVLPFLVTSIPCAYLGGVVPIEREPFFLIVGVALLLIGLRLLFSEVAGEGGCRVTSFRIWLVGLSAGAFLGFFSGLIGIGGGIFLSPILLLLGWSDSKQAASAASLFIIANSAAGLLGHLTKGIPEWETLVPLGIVVLVGGQIGARLGSRSLSRMAVQRVTAALILLVSGRLFWRLALGVGL